MLHADGDMNISRRDSLVDARSNSKTDDDIDGRTKDRGSLKFAYGGRTSRWRIPRSLATAFIFYLSPFIPMDL
jgi:hypothetical protein